MVGARLDSYLRAGSTGINVTVNVDVTNVELAVVASAVRSPISQSRALASKARG